MARLVGNWSMRTAPRSRATAIRAAVASAGNLPGADNAEPDFVATVELSADVSPGNETKGVNTSADMLGILVGVGSLNDFDGVAAAA